jgi:hypothetical protein
MKAEIGRCVGCDAPLAPHRGPGRPRARCAACAADKHAIGVAWRAAHADRVRTYRVRSRVAELTALIKSPSLARSARAEAQLATLRREAGL